MAVIHKLEVGTFITGILRIPGFDKHPFRHTDQQGTTSKVVGHESPPENAFFFLLPFRGVSCLKGTPPRFGESLKKTPNPTHQDVSQSAQGSCMEFSRKCSSCASSRRSSHCAWSSPKPRKAASRSEQPPPGSRRKSLGGVWGMNLDIPFKATTANGAA